MRMPRIAVLSGLLLLGGTSLAAQTVRGVLTEEGSARRISGALVLLLDADGRQASGSLTDEQGRYQIRASAAGRYTLRIQRIGFTTTTGGPFELARGSVVEWPMSVAPLAIDLAGVAVEVRRRRCVLRPEEGLALATLWDEARKALTATAFTQTEGLYRYRIRQYERDLEALTLRVRDEQSRTRSGYFRSPYVSLPAGDLLEGGFIQRTPRNAFYYAPDAGVLLSDEFRDAYCLRLTEGEEGMIGIAFEPAERARRSVGIAGTLWLDRETFHLAHLEYRYLGTEHLSGDVRRVGGRVEFEALPTGAWIVHRWWIRMPAVASYASPRLVAGDEGRSVITGFREEGGEVLQIFRSDGSPVR